ncbi:helix-turn-helix domain-containing protein [Puia dinghuensis]|uniref:AraC family transcriptional regulator n=1 Tax=Puia dinghuensis TaxID=1792502 RepID=A0A8J2UG21_9BACT|nr:AraC family transcriptional regulator [Puia dinghuensis]GGB12850.1 AraC family transcriptional regulator [Puia dinghuensis]
MNLQRFHPGIALQPYVREFVLIETEEAIDSMVIPDTSLVFSLRYKGAVKKMETEAVEALPDIAVSGLRKSVRHFIYAGKTANFMILFKEGGISAFSRMPANELFDQSVSADNLFRSGELNELLERLAEAGNNKARVDLVESFLLHHLASTRHDLLIGNAVQLIRQHNGIIRINDLATSLHLSQDPFEKRFRALVGSTPKQYASIIRLRGLIQKYPSYSSLTEACYDAGYFDQSHFIKDFRLFTGRTPKEFFQSSRFW